jgi:hypothetical protein
MIASRPCWICSAVGANGSVETHSITLSMPSDACATRSSSCDRTALTMSHPTALSTATIASSAMAVASALGTPLRRIQRIAGAKADARMSAIVTGIITSVSWVIAKTRPATATTTMMPCSALVANRPKLSPQTDGVATGARRASRAASLSPNSPMAPSRRGGHGTAASLRRRGGALPPLDLRTAQDWRRTPAVRVVCAKTVTRT